MVGELDRRGRLKTPDVHAEVFKQLTDSLKTSQVTEVDFSSCGIGAVSVNHLSDWVRDATAGVVSVNCLANHFGDEGLATLLTAIEGTSVRSLCGLTEGETTADFSGQNLSPIDCKILAAEFDFRGFIAALNSIMLDECLLTGTKIKNKGWGNEEIELGADLSGFTALCSSLSSSQIVSISLRKCYLGPQALALLTDAIKVMAAVNSLTIDSTGSRKLCYPDNASQEQVDASGPKTYTFTAGEETVDLSSKNLGPADVNLLTAWVVTPAGAALTEVDVRGNGGLDRAAVDALRAAAPETCKILAD
jgi:hypothetical protein